MPNEAIIESGGLTLVYVLQPDGSYAPREIKVGIRGELFSQVLEGLETGRAGRHNRQLLHRRRTQAEGVVVVRLPR